MAIRTPVLSPPAFYSGTKERIATTVPRSRNDGELMVPALSLRHCLSEGGGIAAQRWACAAIRRFASAPSEREPCPVVGRRGHFVHRDVSAHGDCAPAKRVRNPFPLQ